MKYIKAFISKSDKDNSRVVWSKDPKHKPNHVDRKVMSREKAEELFDHIVNTFDLNKLSRYDSGPWGYYFWYEDIKISPYSVQIDKIFYKLPIDIQDGIVDFLESKGKGRIRETPAF